MDIKFITQCQACNGTGIRTYNASPNGPLVTEDPCTKCGGDGVRVLAKGLEGTWFDDVTDKLADIKEKVDENAATLKEIKELIDKL